MNDERDKEHTNSATQFDSGLEDSNKALPFPFNQQTFCLYEPVEPRIEEMRILVVDTLLRDEGDLSDVARHKWGRAVEYQLRRERFITGLAIENIVRNIKHLVKRPLSKIIHLSELAEAEEAFKPEAIVLNDIIKDFDYYNAGILENFGRFVRGTRTPVLGIGGAHQLIGLSFGARVITLDGLEQHEKRENRPIEYQYRFIRITEPDDPIFRRLGEFGSAPQKPRILRVWQNHGLQLDGVPDGFTLLATSYLCRNQMMVRRDDEQLIYSMQFYLEKSFEDWNRSRTRWEHPNESRDGRILFENFLIEAIKHTHAIRERQPREGQQNAEGYAIARIKEDETQPLYVNRVFTLQVGVQDKQPDGSQVVHNHGPRRNSIQFDVVVNAQDMTSEPNWIQSYDFRRDEDVQFVEFRLTPTKPGRKLVRIEFLYERHWLTNIELEVDVVDDQNLHLIA